MPKRQQLHSESILLRLIWSSIWSPRSDLVTAVIWSAIWSHRSDLVTHQVTGASGRRSGHGRCIQPAKSLNPHGLMGIRSILEDSPILLFFFRFSLLMLCICCKVRDLHMSRCVRITKHKQQQRSCILVQTRTQHKKRVPTVAEKCRRCCSLFSQV